MSNKISKAVVDAIELIDEIDDPRIEQVIVALLVHTQIVRCDESNEEIREAIRRIYCMGITTWLDLMDFNSEDYSTEKFQQVQRNPAMALVNDLDERHSNLLLDWALRR